MNALRKLAAMATVVASVQSAEAMDYSYRLYKGRVVIDATGRIEKDEHTRFLDFLKTLPPGVLGKRGNAVVFNSDGGSVLEGYGVGFYIKSYQFATGVAVGGECSSACVLAWAMGTRKSSAPDSHIGVHNATLNGEAGRTTDRLSSLGVTGWMGQLLQKDGAPDNVIAKMIETPSDSVYYLTAEDLAAWNVIVVGDPASSREAPVLQTETVPTTPNAPCAQDIADYRAAQSHMEDAIAQEEYGQWNKTLAAGLRIMRVGRQILADCQFPGHAAFQRHIEDGERMNQQFMRNIQRALER
jgi:hypothetical protein